MEQSITIGELQAVAEKTRKDIRSEGGFPRRRRQVPRDREKDEALFLLRLNASVKFGVTRCDDGTFRLQKR